MLAFVIEVTDIKSEVRLDLRGCLEAVVLGYRYTRTVLINDICFAHVDKTVLFS